ncbi:MAG: hypothetical protein KGR26_13460, partial [Cyanobacteria bacterium REEB65]|nr:hypothetical protein [Cyanobacteria bacterium REEB65]
MVTIATRAAVYLAFSASVACPVLAAAVSNASGSAAQSSQRQSLAPSQTGSAAAPTLEPYAEQVADRLDAYVGKILAQLQKSAAL